MLLEESAAFSARLHTAIVGLLQCASAARTALEAVSYVSQHAAHEVVRLAPLATGALTHPEAGPQRDPFTDIPLERSSSPLSINVTFAFRRAAASKICTSRVVLQ